MKVPLVGKKGKGLYAVVDKSDYENVTRWYASNMIDGKRIRSKYYDTFKEAQNALFLMRQGIIPNK